MLLQTIIESSHEAIIGHDPDGNITSWNPAATRTFGYSAEEIVGHSVLRLMPSRLQPEVPEMLRQIRAGKRIVQHETERITRNGQNISVTVTISPVLSANGEIVGACEIILDRSDLSRADNARFLLAAIVESSDDAIIAKDLNGTILSWNAAASRIFGYTAEEIVGQPVLRLIPPELHSEEPVILATLQAGERIDHFETQRLTKEGKRVEVSLTISPVRDLSGRIIGASKIVRDISDRKRVDEDKYRLAAIVESSDDAIIGKDLNGIVMSWNISATRILGYQPEEMIGQSILRIIPPELHHEEPEILRRIRAGQRIEHYETERIRKDGERIPLSLTISPIRNSQGQVIGVSKIARDISDRKRTQQALIESERFAATGRMAAAIAHEINNPLEAITNLAYLMTTDASLSKESRRYSELLLEEVSRVSTITRQTLSFYRDMGKPTDTPMNELLDNIVEMYRAKIVEKDLRILKEYGAPALVRGFSVELRQVFANLICNAIDALPQGGEIRVRTKVFGGGPVNAPERIMITIADNGSGIDPMVRQRIFEPFFTTKPGKGTGLGLWVSNGIIKKHGGNILVRSRTVPGNSGTAFVVVLPRKSASPADMNRCEDAVQTAL